MNANNHPSLIKDTARLLGYSWVEAGDNHHYHVYKNGCLSANFVKAEYLVSYLYMGLAQMGINFSETSKED